VYYMYIYRKGASIDRLSGAGASAGVFSSTLGVVWPQCWLCAVCAVGRAGCCVGGGVPCGGKHIIIGVYTILSLPIFYGTYCKKGELRCIDEEAVGLQQEAELGLKVLCSY